MISVSFAIAAALMGATTTTTAPASAPAGANDAQAVITRALQQYQAARSYEDTVIASTEVEVEGRSDVTPPEPSPRSIAFARPARLALTTPIYRVVSDGQKLWQVVDPWWQYSESAVPSELRVSSISLSEFGFFKEMGHPLLAPLLSAETPSLDFLGKSIKFEGVQSETLDGVPGKRIRTRMIHEPARTEIPAEIWCDDANGLIGEIVYDNTKAVQTRPGVVVKKFIQRYRFKDVRFNQPLADDRFTFKPGEYLEKVAALKMPNGRELQERIVGKPAVDFTGKDLDGKDASLAEFKGRVLLLDFWSQRCGPCLMSMPALQRVADKYKDKPVSVVGVNLDGPSSRTAVEALLKGRNVTFRHLIQTQPSLADRYFVEGIPCMVVIDAKGIVQVVHVGMAMEENLSRQIDTLLKGENLFK
jgi:thiol-disulfide isomerase/thioredoxin/outer membrane lipoprotein-sorting protein